MIPSLKNYGEMAYHPNTGEITAHGLSIAQVLNGPYVGYHHTLGIAMASATKMLSALKLAVELYGKPGGPWNVPSEPGSWLAEARDIIAMIEGAAQ